MRFVGRQARVHDSKRSSLSVCQVLSAPSSTFVATHDSCTSVARFGVVVALHDGAPFGEQRDSHKALGRGSGGGSWHPRQGLWRRVSAHSGHRGGPDVLSLRCFLSRLGCSWNVLQPAVELCWPLRSRRFRRLQQCNARNVELRVWRVPWGEFPMPFTIACPAPRCALAFSEFFYTSRPHAACAREAAREREL